MMPSRGEYIPRRRLGRMLTEALSTLARLGYPMDKRHPSARTRAAFALLSSVDQSTGPFRAAHAALERVDELTVREIYEYIDELGRLDQVPLSVRILTETLPGAPARPPPARVKV